MMVANCLAAREESEAWRSRLVFSYSGQGILLAGDSPDPNLVMTQADLIHADGISVVFALKFTRSPLPELVSETNFFHKATNVASDQGLRFFMVCASQNQNDAAVVKTRRRYPKRQIAGRHHGTIGELKEEEIIAMIRAGKADVLWVALGRQNQEHWSNKARDKLKGIVCIKTRGGLYKSISGESPREPLCIQNIGAECVYPAADNPLRLLRGYLTKNSYAAYRLMKYTNYRSAHEVGTGV